MREPPILRSPDPPVSTSDPAGAEPPRGSGFRDNRWVVLMILFLGTGCLGLPLLWSSRAFSHKEKVIWSIVVTLYTLALLAAIVGFCWWLYLRVMSALGNGM